MSYLVLDLETIRDVSLPLPEPRPCKGRIPTRTDYGQGHVVTNDVSCGHIPNACPKCGTPADVFLPPSFHRIVSIGWAFLERATLAIQTLGVVNAHREGEASALQTLFHVITPSTTLVGWNSRGFDAPVLAARALAHGIPWPWYYANKFGARYRYSQEDHYDVKDVLGDHGGARSASLDAVAKSIGLPGKVGTDGSMVEGMVAEGHIAEVCSYCACDVAQTAGVLMRMELLRGRLGLEAYRSAANGLVATIDEYPDLVALRGKTDIEKFTLCVPTEDTQHASASALPEKAPPHE